jgi:DNA-binding NtrC family response regulator
MVTILHSDSAPWSADSPALPSRRVVVVEPDGVARTRIAGALLRSGVQVCACAGADDAARALDRLRPHLLVTNARLVSGSDGLRLAVEFAARAAHLRVVILHDDDATARLPDTVAGRATLVRCDSVTSASTLLAVVGRLLAGVPATA